VIGGFYHRKINIYQNSGGVHRCPNQSKELLKNPTFTESPVLGAATPGLITVEGEVTRVSAKGEKGPEFGPSDYKHIGRIVVTLSETGAISFDETCRLLKIHSHGVAKRLLDKCVKFGILMQGREGCYMPMPHLTGCFADPYCRRLAEHREVKRRIAHYVAWEMPLRIAGYRISGVATLPPGVPGLMVDPGTLAHAVVTAIIDKAGAGHSFPNLFTNNIHSAMVAANDFREVRMPPGRLDPAYGAILGCAAQRGILQEFPDGCATVLSTKGITAHIGIGIADESQRGIKRALCEKGLTGTLIIVTDHHKVFPTFSIFEDAEDPLRRRVEQEAYVVTDQLPLDTDAEKPEGATTGDEDSHEDITEDYAAALQYLTDNYYSSQPEENRLTVLDAEGKPLQPQDIPNYLKQLQR